MKLVVRPCLTTALSIQHWVVLRSLEIELTLHHGSDASPPVANSALLKTNIVGEGQSEWRINSPRFPKSDF
jgi:hypothetical protein